MPLGGERAGNAAGTIPPWDGGLSTPPASYQPGMHHPDPYAADTQLYRVDASNQAQYKALLTPGLQMLLEKISWLLFSASIRPTAVPLRLSVSMTPRATTPAMPA